MTGRFEAARRIGRAAWRLPLAVVAALVLTLPSAAAELVLAVAQTSLSLPVYVAESRQFFATEGVAVRTVDCSGGSRCIRQLFDGSAQLATASELPVVFNSFERSDYAVIASFVSSSRDTKLITRRSTGIAGPKQLEGRRVGTVKGTSAHYFLDTYLLFHDVDPKRVTMVALTAEQLGPALQRGEVDAVAIWEPVAWRTRQALAADAVELVAPRIYSTTFNLIADRRSLGQREPELIKVLRALERADRFIREQPRAAQEILKARLQLDQAYVDATWKEFDYRLGLDQSLIGSLEGEARWALREGHVPADRKAPNYLEFVEPRLLRSVVPGAVTTLK